MRSVLCRSAGVLAVGVLLALGLVAAADAAEVHDFSDIQAGQVVITPDPSGRSAVLEVDTAIDVACSVVYGEDETFGHIAVDADMDGGAHRDHGPVMGGLEPDTEYRYRLQGTAPDGAIYVSEVSTFRTPPAPSDARVDLAVEAAVSGVSSQYSDSFAAARAIDGDPSTEWSSRGDGDDAWIELDLGATRSIGEVVFRTRSMSDGTAITHTYSVTADGTELGPFAADETIGED
jgi:phosphodiesterase/alkaline phosphatase D-like protein